MSNGFDTYVQEAQLLQSSGDIEGALEMFKSALADDPTNEEIRRRLIDLTMEKGDFQQVVVEFFDWAEACQENGAIDEAIRIYQEILGIDTTIEGSLSNLDPETAEATMGQVRETINTASSAIFFNLGFLYLDRGAAEESISCLQKSLEFNPSDPKTHTLLGQVYMQKGMDKEANGEFQEVVRLAPDEAAYAYEMLGEIFIRSGKPPQPTIPWFRNASDLYCRNSQMEEAVRALERILSFDPRNKEILTRLGEVFIQQGRRDMATETYLRLADAYNEEGLLDKVLATYEKMVEWDPSNLDSRERVIDMYRHILNMDPSNLTARSKLIGNILRKGAAEEAVPEFITLSSTYLERGMKKEARAVCKKLLELDPNNPMAHDIFGDIHYDEDQKDKALEEYLAAIRLFQDRGDEINLARMNEKLSSKFLGMLEISLQLARSFREQGLMDKALMEYGKILDKEPRNLDVLTSVLEVHESQRDTEKVLSLAAEILEIDPSRADVRDKLLAIYEQRKDHARLLEIYGSILAADFARNDIRQKMLDIYQGQGDLENVINMYRQMLELDPDRADLRQKMIEYYASEGKIEEVLGESSALADIFLRNDDFEKAEGLYKNVLAFMPGDLTIRDRLCNIFRRRGETDKVQEEMLVLVSVGQLQGDPQTALNHCRTLLEEDPDDVNMKAKYASLLAQAGQAREAVEIYQEIARFFHERKLEEPAMKIIGNILDIDGSNVEYRLHLIELLISRSMVSEAVGHYFLLASHFLDSGDEYRAADASREAISLNPGDLEFRKKLVDLFLQAGSFEQARHFADELVELHINQGQYQEVIDVYDSLAREYQEKGEMSSCYEFREKIARIYERQARFPEAIQEYLQILKSNLLDSKIHEGERLLPVIIDLYFKEKRPSESIDSLKSIVEALHDEGRLQEALIVLEHVENVQNRLSQPGAALETLGEMIGYYRELEENGKVVATYTRRIEILLGLDRVDDTIGEMFQIIRHHLTNLELEEAILQFREVEVLRPSDPGLTFRMGEILFEFEMFDQAAATYEKVLESAPDNYEALARLAIIKAKAGSLQEAVTYTRKIFSKGLVAEVIEEYKRSSYKDIEESQIHINLGLFYQEMGFIEEAIFEYQSAAQDPRMLLEAQNRMALCFKQEGFTELAIRQFERALEQPGYPEEEYLPIRYNLGEIFLENGQLQEALTAFYECYMVDINYRDIAEKIAFLNEKLQSPEGAQADTVKG
jgi:tetratricopeptide (TPR) repeat protein